MKDKRRARFDVVDDESFGKSTEDVPARGVRSSIPRRFFLLPRFHPRISVAHISRPVVWRPLRVHIPPCHRPRVNNPAPCIAILPRLLARESDDRISLLVRIIAENARANLQMLIMPYVGWAYIGKLWCHIV